MGDESTSNEKEARFWDLYRTCYAFARTFGRLGRWGSIFERHSEGRERRLTAWPFAWSEWLGGAMRMRRVLPQCGQCEWGTRSRLR